MHPASRALSGLGRLRRGLGNVNTSGMIDNYDGTFTDPVTGNLYSTSGNPIDPTTGLPITGTLTPAAPPAASIALPPCSSVVVPPGFVGPVNCNPAGSAVNYGVSQSQLAALGQSVQAQINAITAASTGQWFSGISNTAVVAIAAGAVFFLFMGRR